MRAYSGDYRSSIKPGTWNIPEHSGTFRNIPEHPGTSNNYDKKYVKLNCQRLKRPAIWKRQS